ncbi:lysophospholipid acyltransferase family protein [Gallaecimonas xiamenensis]|uniref:Phospholipid/glycerol acyltransferase n=1 Tax=Gallaecimonas xiamenensis 3-C-1 TaxID=745411 RepID=K2IHA0_9GAMM|nr:lysophospholipid acyltransferase family protein [Gallaecimonas xiamenensis]EKE69491.1 phospholipid/glycerol acyltransferase [Gallaecimonas xiamenensis 3-C-1]
MQRFYAWLFARLGWRIEGQLPELPHYVLVAAPHSSNWDFVLGILARNALGAPIRFLGKHQLFRFPFGWFFRALGGYPVRRDQHNNLVDQVVAYFRQEPSFVLGLAPEGTRSPVSRWKLGFYHIAKSAGVPLVLVGFDYPNKRFVIGPPLQPGPDMVADLQVVEAFYRQVQGKYPKVIPPLLGYDPHRH